jgi:hypothetical protein
MSAVTMFVDAPGDARTTLRRIDAARRVRRLDALLSDDREPCVRDLAVGNDIEDGDETGTDGPDEIPGVLRPGGHLRTRPQPRYRAQADQCRVRHERRSRARDHETQRPGGLSLQPAPRPPPARIGIHVPPRGCVQLWRVGHADPRAAQNRDRLQAAGRRKGRQRQLRHAAAGVPPRARCADGSTRDPRGSRKPRLQARERGL